MVHGGSHGSAGPVPPESVGDQMLIQMLVQSTALPQDEDNGLFQLFSQTVVIFLFFCYMFSYTMFVQRSSFLNVHKYETIKPN